MPGQVRLRISAQSESLLTALDERIDEVLITLGALVEDLDARDKALVTATQNSAVAIRLTYRRY